MTNQETAGATQAPNVHNGTYTIESPERGHFTLKLYTVERGELAGKRIVALLVGADNVDDFRAVAFWDDDAREARVWKRYASGNRDAASSPLDGYHWGDKWNSTEQKLAIWTDLVNRAYRHTDTGLEELPTLPDGSAYDFRHKEGLFDEKGARMGTSYWKSHGYALLLEGRCLVCNRKLTDPTSIRLGIGPKCGGRS